MTLSIVFDYAVATGALLCVVLQFATFRMARDPILRAGRAMLLAGWTIGALRLLFVMVEEGDLPLPVVTQLWLGLLEGGTVLVTMHWIQHRGDDEWRATH